MLVDSMFDLYIYLYNQKVERIDVLNIAPAFFGLTIHALLENATIRLCRLYDSDKNTITITKYINYVEQNTKAIFDEKHYKEIYKIVQESKKKIESFSKEISELKSMRDTALAHNDPCKLTINFDMWSDKDIHIADIHNLIEYGATVVNNFCHFSDSTVHSISATNKLDVEGLLNILERYKSRKG